jgi:hypothetical protein
MTPPPSEDANVLPSAGPVISLLSKLAEDIRSPVVFSLLIMNFSTTAWLAYDHVSKSDVSIIKTQSAGIQYSLQHYQIENRIGYLQDKIFNLNERIAADKTDNPEVHEVYRERMNDLTGQEAGLNRDMNLLEHQQR